MKIAYLASGAAGMLCGTCLHDNTLAVALLAAGEDVALLPTYTPLRSDETTVARPELFYGALNVYLEQSSGLFRALPRRLRNWLDRPGLLNLVSRWSGSTNASDLGPLTLSMLRGEDGHQRVELDRLVNWLAEDLRPDVVHLSNSLFLGMARRIRERVGAPVVVALSGEDLFIEALAEPYRARVIGELRLRAADAAALVAPSHDYAARMAALLAVPVHRVSVARLGLDLAGFPLPGVATTAVDEGPPGQRPVVIGYLARQCPEKGLHLLIDAFAQLRAMPDLPPLELRVAGYLGARDRDYVDSLRARTVEQGSANAVKWVGELDRVGKVAFLRDLDLFSVPTVYREAKGLSILEAMAAGVAVVQPRHGSFPEIVAATGGGILVDPDSSGALARGLRTLVLDAPRRAALAASGHAASHRLYSAAAMAADNLAIYRQVLTQAATLHGGTT